jgi:hypothetical protein
MVTVVGDMAITEDGMIKKDDRTMYLNEFSSILSFNNRDFLKFTVRK